MRRARAVWEVAATLSQMSELTPDVQRLLNDHIESYEQLEMLLLMRGDQVTSWTEETLSEQLRIALSLVQAALAGLESGGLIRARAHQGVSCYSYLHQSDEVEATIGRLAAAYRENPFPIVKVMSANSLDRLRRFADAFILRKDKNRG